MPDAFCVIVGSGTGLEAHRTARVVRVATFGSKKQLVHRFEAGALGILPSRQRGARLSLASPHPFTEEGWGALAENEEDLPAG